LKVARFERLVIIGCGRVGSAFAAAARSLELASRITAVDTSAEVLGRMLEGGICDEAMFDPRPAVQRADAVLVCVPVSAVVQVLWTILDDLQPGTLIVDTANAKTRIVRETDEFMPLTVHYISTHPFVSRNPQAAGVDFFKGGVCVMTPSESTKPEAMEKALDLYRALGMRVIQMDAGDHDVAVAALEQLPSVISISTLLALDGSAKELPHLMEFGADRLKDLIRHAPKSSSNWADRVIENREQVANLVERLEKVMGALRDALVAGNEKKLDALLTKVDIMLGRTPPPVE
jgi:prephenate dehydrogenase